MKTPAVMCMAETRQKPSLMPDLASSFSTSPVRRINSRCFFVLNHMYAVCDFISSPFYLYLFVYFPSMSYPQNQHTFMYFLIYHPIITDSITIITIQIPG